MNMIGVICGILSLLFMGVLGGLLPGTPTFGLACAAMLAYITVLTGRLDKLKAAVTDTVGLAAIASHGETLLSQQRHEAMNYLVEQAKQGENISIESTLKLMRNIFSPHFATNLGYTGMREFKLEDVEDESPFRFPLFSSPMTAPLGVVLLVFKRTGHLVSWSCTLETEQDITWRTLEEGVAFIERMNRQGGMAFEVTEMLFVKVDDIFEIKKG